MIWWPFGKYKASEPEPKVERKREPCILEGEGVGLSVPTTSYIKKGRPLLIIEPTHYDVMQHGLPPVRTYSFRDPSKSDLRNLPVGVYTIEPYMELDEFIREAEPERDTEAVSG